MDRMRPDEPLTSRGNFLALAAWFTIALLEPAAQMLERLIR